MTKKQIKNEITLSKRNEKFWAKTDAQKRIAIAKDVIKHLDSKFYYATTGVYAVVSMGVALSRKDYKLENAPEKADDTLCTLEKAGASCDVCGIGSIFLSQVLLGNKVRTLELLTGEEKKTNTIEDYTSFSVSKMRKNLRLIFPPRQLTLIECAFEASIIPYDDKDRRRSGSYYDEKLAARKFGERYRRSDSRLRAIMNNIIKNKGEFIP